MGKINGQHGIIIERLDNLISSVNEFKEDNKKDHKEFHDSLTNGVGEFAEIKTKQRFHKRLIIAMWTSLGGMLLLVLKLTGKI